MSIRIAAALLPLLLWPAPTTGQEQSEVYLGTHEGITVIHREIPGSRIAEVRVFLLGGPSVGGAANAGIEPLFLRVAAHGTAGYPGTESMRRTAQAGATIWVSADPDWTVFAMESLAEDFGEIWDVFADRLLAPTLSPEALELERRHVLDLMGTQPDDPESRAFSMATDAAFHGHVYDLPVNGDETTLSHLSADSLRAFHGNHVVKSRMLVAVVGGVSRGEATERVEETLGSLPQGDYVWAPPPSWGTEESSMSMTAMNVPTNYLYGVFGGPPATDERFPAFQLAVGTLSGLISMQTREEGLSYSAGAHLLDRAASGGIIYMSTNRPERCMEIVDEWIDTMQDAILRRSNIRTSARKFLLDFYIQNETPGAQASFLARTYLSRGRVESLDAFIDELHDVDPADIRRMARDYFENIRWVFVGDTRLVPTGVGG